MARKARTPSAVRSGPLYPRIAGELEAGIRSGEFRSARPLPSRRRIADRWGVGVATVARAIAMLREAGLVEVRRGSGMVVSAPPGRATVLSREDLLRTAVAIADVEGGRAVAMRRVAAELGAGAMSLYRHVANKDELVMQLADLVFGEVELPVPGPAGWRAKLELVARRQWALCRQYPWLPRAVSFTRPLFAPNMVRHTEWTLRALDGLGLARRTRMYEALAPHSLVLDVALSTADEVVAEQESGLTLATWSRTQRARTEELFASGRFPLLAEVHEDAAPTSTSCSSTASPGISTGSRSWWAGGSRCAEPVVPTRPRPDTNNAQRRTPHDHGDCLLGVDSGECAVRDSNPEPAG